MKVTKLSAVIESSGTDSTIVDLGNSKYPHPAFVGMVTPADFTSTTVTIKAGLSEDDMKAVTDKDGNALSITVSANKWIYLDPGITAGFQFIQLISGLPEAGQRIIQIIVREID